ncbi:hypothetical protein [Wolbachia endosymbiont (group B) of Episyrphus balteatus]|uniref:hypothetical protein n=1 Tax=Wolbachia endosymbiont (group B) of Episyrphus balteatus TaxID=2954009 RepID=UPI0022266218|nr:hypothetical protein [Wolbachia endosymbiont (group B) of Episyrphus balteatus]
MKNAYFTTKCVSSHILKSFSSYNTPQPTLAMQQSHTELALLGKETKVKMRAIAFFIIIGIDDTKTKLT